MVAMSDAPQDPVQPPKGTPRAGFLAGLGGGVALFLFLWAMTGELVLAGIFGLGLGLAIGAGLEATRH